MGYTFPGTRVDLGGGRGWLDAPAAASLFRIDRAIGHRCQISEAGRSWEQQLRFWQIFQSGGNIALHPDTPSEHQKGKAVDSDEAQQFVALMEEHGWRRTVYRWVNGVWTLVERWHFEYFAHLDKHINDGAPASDIAAPIPIQSEEDDMPINFRNGATGITYTMVPGHSILAHVNGFGDRLTNFVNTGKWPASEDLKDRYNAGLRDLNRDHVAWMLPFYGFGRLTPETLPQPGTIVYADKIVEQDAKLKAITDSITPGQSGVKFDGQLWAHIAQSGHQS